MKIVILDTSVVVHYMLNSPLYRTIESEMELTDADCTPVISSVTKGELLSFANQHNWPREQVESLSQFLKVIATVDVKSSDDALQNAYSTIDAFSKGKIGSFQTQRKMGKNDLWIAATAYVLDAPLVTNGNAFDHLDKTIITVRKFT